MGDRTALEQDAALARMDEAHDGLQGRALADAVAAEEAHHLAPADFERHPVQDMTLAVVGMDVLDLDQRPDRSAAGRSATRAHVRRAHVFKYTSSTRGFCWISAGVPSARIS